MNISENVIEKHMIPVTPSPSNYSQCLGVVLAGGLSSRMGSDKAQLMRQDKSMLEYSKQLLTQAKVAEVVVSGNDYDVADKYANLGPMAGIYSVMQAHKPQALLILPVDLPLMTSSTLARLKQIGELKQCAVYFEDNFLPLYLPVNAHVETFFQQAFINIKDKGPSMKAMLKQTPSLALKNENPNTLFNANTPQDWQKAKTQFTQRNNYV